MSGQSAERYLAIDVMRGATVALMIIVNMSISDALAFAPLLHATWDGFTLTDAVFPTFLFVAGASLGFTAQRHGQDGAGAYFRKLALRTLRLFACGLVVSNFPFGAFVEGHWVWQAPETLRIMGVLQRIALAYLIAATLVYRGRVGTALAFSVAALAISSAVMALLGDHSLTGNAAVWIDRAVFGAPHLYQHEGAPFDPEGLLGTLPAAVNVLAGYVTVAFLRARAGGPRPRDLLTMVAVGTGLILASGLLDPLVPINKKLWSASYVACTVGIDVIVLAALIQWVDRAGMRAGTGFFSPFGKNALVIYMVAELVMGLAWTIPLGQRSLFMFVYDEGFAWLGAKWGGLAYALVFALLCWLLARALDRRRIYIRL